MNHDRDSATATRHRFTFSGKADQFFGICFTNSILTWLTLGLYGPWAKVREWQYLYGNSELAGGTFQFTADPRKMLMTRLIALLLFVVYVVASTVDNTIAYAVLALMVAAYLLLAPLLLVFALSFRLRFSQWRGVNFGFNKDFAGAYRVYLAPVLLAVVATGLLCLPLASSWLEQQLGMAPPAITATTDTDEPALTASAAAAVAEAGDEWSDEASTGAEEQPARAGDPGYFNPHFLLPGAVAWGLFLLLIPWFDFIHHRFLARNFRFGRAAAHFVTRPAAYYRLWGLWLAASSLLAALIVARYQSGFGLPITLMVLLGISYWLLTWVYFKTRRYNLLMGGLQIDGGHRIEAELPLLASLWLLVSNTLAVVFSFGLMRAWARIRNQRFTLNHTRLLANGSLDLFLNSQQQASSALAEEMADVFDMELELG